MFPFLFSASSSPSFSLLPSMFHCLLNALQTIMRSVGHRVLPVYVFSLLGMPKDTLIDQKHMMVRYELRTGEHEREHHSMHHEMARSNDDSVCASLCERVNDSLRYPLLLFHAFWYLISGCCPSHCHLTRSSFRFSCVLRMVLHASPYCPLCPSAVILVVFSFCKLAHRWLNCPISPNMILS